MDHPAHYGGEDDPYEAIKVIEAWGAGFNIGTVLKYLARAGKKSGESDVKDLRKAAWYLNREIERREKSALAKYATGGIVKHDPAEVLRGGVET